MKNGRVYHVFVLRTLNVLQVPLKILCRYFTFISFRKIQQNLRTHLTRHTIVKKTVMRTLCYWKKDQRKDGEHGERCVVGH